MRRECPDHPNGYTFGCYLCVEIREEDAYRKRERLFRETGKIPPVPGDSKTWLKRSWSHVHLNGSGYCWQCEAIKYAKMEIEAQERKEPQG